MELVSQWLDLTSLAISRLGREVQNRGAVGVEERRLEIGQALKDSSDAHLSKVCGLISAHSCIYIVHSGWPCKVTAPNQVNKASILLRRLGAATVPIRWDCCQSEDSGCQRAV